MAAGERTEEATPRRLERLRAEGRFPRSVDLSAAVGLLASLLVLRLFGGDAALRLRVHLERSFVELARPGLTDADVLALGASSLGLMLGLLAPLLLVLAIGVAINLAQSGLAVSAHGVTPDLSRLNPLAGLQRLFSTHSLVELAKVLVKAALLAIVLGRAYTESLPAMLALAGGDVAATAPRLADLALGLGLTVAGALLVLGILDYGYQRWEFARSARMTKDELREELRQVEGDPRIRARIRALQRKLATSRMMQQVPKADVIVTNPTHLAVALAYDSETMAAPVVLAKGAEAIAGRIREIAQHHGIPVVENPPLAQALYRLVEVGRPIPVELFQAVAEVLAYVYRLRGQPGPRRREP